MIGLFYLLIIISLIFIQTIIADNCVNSNILNKLNVGQCLVSSNQKYSACLRSDGRLCLTSSYFAEWCTASTSPSPSYMLVGTAGLTFYNSFGSVYYTIQSTDYLGVNSHDLLLQDDGNLVLYPSGDHLSGAVWACSWVGCSYQSSCSCYDIAYSHPPGCPSSCDQVCHPISLYPSLRPTRSPTVQPTLAPTTIIPSKIFFFPILDFP